jgi:hypothetical protein
MLYFLRTYQSSQPIRIAKLQHAEQGMSVTAITEAQSLEEKCDENWAIGDY